MWRVLEAMLRIVKSAPQNQIDGGGRQLVGKYGIGEHFSRFPLKRGDTHPTKYL
jgi:hypothetical protein